MALMLAQKKEVVKEVQAIAQKAISAVVADYRGLTVNEMMLLRQQARGSSVYLRVVRNTLAKRALSNTDFDCLNESLVGTTFLAFSLEAPGDAARILHDFGKDHDKLRVKALALSGQLLSAEHLEAVAKLPSRDEALSKLAYVLKAPIARLAQTLAATPGKLVRTVAAVAEQKKKQS